MELNRCIVGFVLGALVVSLAVDSRALADGGPYTVTIDQFRHWKDFRGALPGSIDHANANRGGAAIPWTTQAGISTTVSWTVSVEVGGDDLGLKIGGSASGSTTVDLSTQQSGSVAAPPANAPNCSVNHDVEFFAYEGYSILRTKQTYYVVGGFCNGSPGGFQWPIPENGRAKRQWTVTTNLITYKNSQERYPQNNYPRPDPYVLDKKEERWTPRTCKDEFEEADKVGTLRATNPNVARNWN